MGDDAFVVSVRKEEHISVSVPCRNIAGPMFVVVKVRLASGEQAEAELTVDDQRSRGRLRPGRITTLRVDCPAGPRSIVVRATTRALGQAAGVEWSSLRIKTPKGGVNVPVRLPEPIGTNRAPPVLPPLRLC